MVKTLIFILGIFIPFNLYINNNYLAANTVWDSHDILYFNDPLHSYKIFSTK